MTHYHTTTDRDAAIRLAQTLNQHGHNAVIQPAGAYFQIYILPPITQHNGHKPTAANTKKKKATAPPQKQKFKITFLHILYALTILSFIIAALSK